MHFDMGRMGKCMENVSSCKADIHFSESDHLQVMKYI